MKNIEYYQAVHQSWKQYGAGSRHYNFVVPILIYLKSRRVLDYGCGKGVLADQLDDLDHLTCEKYDPAIPEYQERPQKIYDCVVNTDVLEHIPEQELDDTLRHFPVLSSQAIVIPHLKKAGLILPNGENAHCTIKKPDEWSSILRSYYKFVTILPHESDRHALLLCSQHEIDVAPLTQALKLVAERMKDRAFVQARLDDPFKLRARRAIKLLLGKNVIK